MSQATISPNTIVFGYVPNIYSAEDLAYLPDTGWLVASGMSGPGNQGHLYAVDREAKTATEIFPIDGEVRPDDATYGDIEPPDLTNFSAVGLALRPGADGVHTLYVVNHGGRAAIEVFEVDSAGSVPRAAWVGAILLDPGVWGNAVAILPDGGLVATNFMSTDDPEAGSKVLGGEITGNIQEWHPDGGWTNLPGTECCSPNGVEISPDGEWLFVNAWAIKKVLRISRGRTPVQRDEIDVPILPDNIKWTSDGRLLVTGQTSDAATVFAGIKSPTYDVGLKVLSIEPQTFQAQEVLSFSHPGGFGTAATALEVGDTIWVSSARSDRIAYFQPV